MDESTRKVMHSSANTEWGTPQNLFDYLDLDFHFNLDVCATANNAKCKAFYSPEQDGLIQPWLESRCWCNPPYGRGSGGWLGKCVGNDVVALLPARTETKRFKIVWEHADAICFISGRLTFEGADHPAPFPSALAVFGFEDVEYWEHLENLGHVVRWKL